MHRKGNPSTLLVEMQTGAATVENTLEFPQKTKIGTAFSPSNSAAAKEPMHPNVHSSTIYNIEVVEAT